MELNFKQSAQKFNNEPAYEVEFEVTSDFNLHIERPRGGEFYVYQKGIANARYAIVDYIGGRIGKDVIDLDFIAAVYPKHIKVVCESEPSMAIVTFNA